jgi:hypothetical protein
VFWGLSFCLVPVLLLLFAGLGRGLPWQPEQVRTLVLASAESNTSALKSSAAELGVRGGDAEGRALVLVRTDPFDVKDLPLLRVNLADADVVHAMRVVLLQGADLRVAPFPGHVEGARTMDLRRAGFKGGPIEGVGLMFAPTDTLPAAAAPEIDVRVLSLQLQSPSIDGYVQALLNSWLAYRPWTGRSNHTLGFEHGPHPTPGLQAFVAAWLAGSVVLVVLVRPAASRRRLAVVLLMALLGCAAATTHQLLKRAEVSLQAARRVAGYPSLEQSAMPELAAELKALRKQWANAPPSRAVVWGVNGFLREYPVWLLREFPVAGLRVPEDLRSLHTTQTIELVLTGQSGWRYEFRSGELSVGSLRMPAVPLFRGQWVNSFSISNSERRR